MSRHAVNGTFEKSFRLQEVFGKNVVKACHIIENKCYVVAFIPLKYLKDKADLHRRIEEVRCDSNTGYVTSWIETMNNTTQLKKEMFL